VTTNFVHHGAGKGGGVQRKRTFTSRVSKHRPGRCCQRHKCTERSPVTTNFVHHGAGKGGGVQRRRSSTNGFSKHRPGRCCQREKGAGRSSVATNFVHSRQRRRRTEKTYFHEPSIETRARSLLPTGEGCRTFPRGHVLRAPRRRHRRWRTEDAPPRMIRNPTSQDVAANGRSVQSVT
jgi:hypothetical protein